jgi:hypothetical protein
MANKTLSVIVLGSAIVFTGCGDGKANLNKFNKFPREKILTISVKDYCENKGKNIADYELIGVRGEKPFDNSIPSGTEAIVSYIGGGLYGNGACAGAEWEAGTALIPKKK